MNINDVINDLTIVDIERINNRKFYICKCVCGNIIKVRSDYIKNKHDCGCSKINDLTNKTFNKLTAIKCVGRKHGNALWLCHCECGKQTEVVSTKLVSGEIQSCGCIKHNNGKHTKQYRGCGDLSGYTWSSIKNCAKARQLDFNITIEYAWNLFEKQNKKCALSGMDIVLCDRRYGEEITASLDRIDSSKGYVEDNVQWVHKHVNKIKQDFDEEYFQNLCTKIYEKNKNCIEYIERPSWIEYFLQIAIDISARSIDAQTKHGCVITNKQHQIIGTGYNSFVKNMPDDILPNKRPLKYKNIIHSEANAITNCIVSPHMFTDGCTAYITGRPCLNCLSLLVQNNINEIYVLNRFGSVLENDDVDEVNLIIQANKVKYVVVDFIPKNDVLPKQ